MRGHAIYDSFLEIVDRGFEAVHGTVCPILGNLIVKMFWADYLVYQMN